MNIEWGIGRHSGDHGDREWDCRREDNIQLDLTIPKTVHLNYM